MGIQNSALSGEEILWRYMDCGFRGKVNAIPG